MRREALNGPPLGRENTTTQINTKTTSTTTPPMTMPTIAPVLSPLVDAFVLSWGPLRKN